MAPDELGFVGIAVVLVCVLSTARGVLATVTAVPLVAQALQLLGLAFLAQLAWRRSGGLRGLADRVPRVSWPTPTPTPGPSS
jgi:threonine/homoserine/homoserine lactone efflux protein